MKVAYFAESPADQEALQILSEAILGRETEPVIHAGLRHRGWPAVRTVLPSVLKELHYHTDAVGLVLIVDANGSPPHSAAHGNQPEPRCRLCQLQRIAFEVRQQVRPVPERAPLKIALGLAVPAIEAWLLCGVQPYVTEAAWINGLRTGCMPYAKAGLKEKLYGTSHPSLPIETAAMKTAASRLAENLGLLTSSFPAGFGNLRSSLKSW